MINGKNAAEKIKEILSDKETISEWTHRDLKPKWLARATRYGIEGYHNELQDAFLQQQLNKVPNINFDELKKGI